jgi:hypothetical protein
MTVAKWWRTVQLGFGGEGLMLIALLIAWHEVKLARARQPAESASAGPAGEKTSH